MAGGALIPTGQRFGVSKSALARHRTGCLAPKVAAAAKIVAPSSAGRAEVERAKAIASGTVQPLPDDLLSLTGLLGRLARSLERLEAAADMSITENMPTALAALSSQLHRGIETAAKMQGLYAEPAQAAPTFSITFKMSDEGASPSITVRERLARDAGTDTCSEKPLPDGARPGVSVDLEHLP